MPLDLEEQEQLDSLKAFWEKYRSLIMGLATAVLFAFAAYNGWQWWKNSQATEAGKLYETMMSSIEKGNKEQSMQAADDLQKQFAGSISFFVMCHIYRMFHAEFISHFGSKLRIRCKSNQFIVNLCHQNRVVVCHLIVKPFHLFFK
jgi:hypothetical protein